MKNTLIFSMLFIASFGFSQNLVPNPSFEDTDLFFCGIMTSSDFNSAASEWQTPGDGSPDMYYTNINDTCFNFQPNSTYSGPIGIKGSQIPRTGNIMVGFGAFTIQGMEQREYIEVALSTPLTVGSHYVVEFYVSLADSIEFATDNLGIYLSEQLINQASNSVISATPQIQSNGMITDTQNWVRIADTIEATAPFQYLTIGNFSSDANTNLQANPAYSSKPGTYGAYYFIDDVSVENIRDLNTVKHALSSDRKLIKVIDLMGRETKVKPNIPLIYIYDDGSREKVIVN